MWISHFHASGQLAHYLERTVILTAERLDLALRHAEVGNTPVIEVIPRVPGAPDERWLAAFDGYTEVRDHYDLATDKGERLRVLVEPDAQAVLAEIRRMPGRRIAGPSAEAFLRNPYALLGEAMARVVPPEQFEQAREAAGICFYTFRDEICREPDGHVRTVRLVLESLDEGAPTLPPIELADRATLQRLVDTLSTRLKAGLPCFRWGRHTLELRGDAEERLCRLRAVLHEPWSGEPLIKYAAIYDLARYSPRVEGIGPHRPQYVPYIAQKSGQGGWVPENLEPVVQYQPPGGEPVLVSVSEEAQAALGKWLDGHPPADARFTPPDWPGPVTPAAARLLLDTLSQALSAVKAEQFARPEPKPPIQPKTLRIAQNVETNDYVEERSRQLAFETSRPPQLPTWLRSGSTLQPHQCQGLAWLQHLWTCERHGVRGALLADDMGLGKTLQLLALVAWYLEQAAEQADPVLIVAPVSLLENWQIEINKFFDARLSKQILLLYGGALGQLKLRGHEIDEALRQEGLRTHLRPGWRGAARLVLTTYETLRDLQFSLAQVRWSILICDEAQKIKTPGAMVTHAAKAQNARFKIACTGTPVENSLADLWCLFDFIQPGLLGSLSQFGRTYRRPIEAQAEEQQVKLEELRRLIEPQVLRRFKTVVADLPAKHIDKDCRALPLSSYQRALYSQATQRGAQHEQGNTAALLAMLHRLRSICADPRETGTQPDLQSDVRQHRQRSPKLDWLLAQLEIIRQRQEKVILFTEFRDLQRLLQHRIRQHFGFSPAIVNGSTQASREAGEQSRQALIDGFQRQPGFNAIILSTTAMGFGVNIQAANHVIHFTRPWNPAKEDQATDRAYRIGQTRPVQVYYPTVVAEDFITFEAKLDALLEAKRQLASDMLERV